MSDPRKARVGPPKVVSTLVVDILYEIAESQQYAAIEDILVGRGFSTQDASYMTRNITAYVNDGLSLSDAVLGEVDRMDRWKQITI